MKNSYKFILFILVILTIVPLVAAQATVTIAPLKSYDIVAGDKISIKITPGTEGIGPNIIIKNSTMTRPLGTMCPNTSKCYNAKEFIFYIPTDWQGDYSVSYKEYVKDEYGNVVGKAAEDGFKILPYKQPTISKLPGGTKKISVIKIMSEGEENLADRYVTYTCALAIRGNCRNIQGGGGWNPVYSDLVGNQGPYDSGANEGTKVGNVENGCGKCKSGFTKFVRCECQDDKGNTFTSSCNYNNATKRKALCQKSFIDMISLGEEWGNWETRSLDEWACGSSGAPSGGYSWARKCETKNKNLWSLIGIYTLNYNFNENLLKYGWFEEIFCCDKGSIGGTIGDVICCNEGSLGDFVKDGVVAMVTFVFTPSNWDNIIDFVWNFVTDVIWDGIVVPVLDIISPDLGQAAHDLVHGLDPVFDDLIESDQIRPLYYKDYAIDYGQACNTDDNFLEHSAVYFDSISNTEITGPTASKSGVLSATTYTQSNECPVAVSSLSGTVKAGKYKSEALDYWNVTTKGQKANLYSTGEKIKLPSGRTITLSSNTLNKDSGGKEISTTSIFTDVSNATKTYSISLSVSKQYDDVNRLFVTDIKQQDIDASNYGVQVFYKYVNNQKVLDYVQVLYDDDIDLCNYGASCCTNSPECLDPNCQDCYRTCGNFDSDSALEWSQSIPCDFENDWTCSSATGTCVRSCSNECDTVGLKQCSGSAMTGNANLTCGNYNSDSCFEWNTAIDCPPGTKCTYGVCEWQNDCSPAGTKRCADDTHFNNCTNYDADPALEWSPDIACDSEPEQQKCSGAGVCSSVNECDYAGKKECWNNTAFRNCSYYDADPSLDWTPSPYIACDSGQTCSGAGVCSCSDNCPYLGKKECSGSANLTCGYYDSDTCLEWNTAIDCPPGTSCSNGLCSCTEGCSFAGDKRCFGSQNNQNATCGNYDADSCLEWSSPLVDCPSGTSCINGLCACSNLCTAGARRCIGDANDTCADYNSDGCTEYFTPLTDCPSGTACSGSSGMCMPW